MEFKLQDYTVSTVIHSPTAELIEKSNEIFKNMNVHYKWNKTKGKGVKIAVIDTGVQIDHPILKHAFRKGYNSFNGSSDVVDRQGHGTHVAGVIFGNRIVKGIAPDAEMYVVKALSDEGRGSAVSVARGIDWCVEQDVDVICMSLGSDAPSDIIESAIKRATSKDIICVCASGNDADGCHDTISIDYPAAFEDTIAVGAIDNTKTVANFSSIGNVDVVSFGVNVLSAYPGNSYAILSGTSMATPHIAASVALIQCNAKQRIKRRLKVTEMKTQLALNAIDLGEEGYDKIYGHGKFRF